jgi:hypothetical protein
MIMRRLAQQLREQNWTAISIEFVLLVLGVFLGIQVANWNDDRKAQQRESEVIDRLALDFERIDARLSRSAMKWQRNLDSANQLLADLDGLRKDGHWPREKAAMLIDLNNVTSMNPAAPRAATYVEMLSAAQLGILRDARLRDELREYDTRTESFTRLNATLLERLEPFRADLVAHLQFDSGLTVKQLATEFHRGATRADYFNDADLDALAADPATRAALTQHASTFLDHAGITGLHQDSARTVLGLLRANGKDAGGNTP